MRGVAWLRGVGPIGEGEAAGGEAHARAETFAPAEPTPLMREIPPGGPYPVHALGPLRAVAEAFHDMTQAPPAIGAQSALGVAALATQGLADAETLHGSAPASLFLLTVAQSGERKSACDRLAMKPVRDFEAELAENREREIDAHRDALDVWRKRREAVLRTAADDPITARADLAALGPEPVGPLFASIVSDAPTLEGVTKHMGELRPSLGIFTDEGGAFIGGHGMNPDNRLKTVAGLSALWDGSPVSRWRAQDGVARFTGRRLSLHIMAQPVAAAGLLADPVANGQGFLARFLMAEPPSAIGTRLRVGHAPGSAAALAAFSARVAALLRHPLPLAEGRRNELAPPVLPLSPDARAVLQDFALAVEAAQAKGGEFEGVRPFASKAAEHAARIAAVLTLFENPDAGAVTGETIADAVTLATFYANEAARLSDAATVSAETAEAEKLRRWLLENWGEPFISASDAAQRGPFKETDRARKALATLQRHGWAEPVVGGAEVLGKRRREAWRIVRTAR